jgi:hypothetical protein
MFSKRIEHEIKTLKQNKKCMQGTTVMKQHLLLIAVELTSNNKIAFGINQETFPFHPPERVYVNHVCIHNMGAECHCADDNVCKYCYFSEKKWRPCNELTAYIDIVEQSFS